MTGVLTRDVAEGVHRVCDAHVNWYLVEDGDALTVVDAGHPRSWESLGRALEALGRSPGDVAAVVLTHGHFDHVGFAAQAKRELGVPVLVPEGDRDIAAHPWRYPHERPRTPYAIRHPSFVREFAAMAAAGALTVDGVDATPVPAGVALDVPGAPIPVATPGHTPGHCSMHLRDRGVVIAGDALVTHDPYTGGDGPRIIAGAATADSRQALRSLDRLAGADADVLLPGHGEPWRGSLRTAVEAAREVGPT